MDQILDAAAQVFGEAGYEAATTNAIAARAGVSPGSLYQFFGNKDAVAEALAARYAEGLGAAQRQALAPDVAKLPLEGLIDRVVDPLIDFNIAHPGFKALFARSDMPAAMTAATRPLHAAVSGRVEAIIAARAPDLPADRCARTAQISVHMFKALLPLVLAAEGAERATLRAELKQALHRYLEPVIGVAPRR
ncbi:TetR/AcrR family transcriptional regulator [Actinomadura sp. 1N219]|uniref:TetR/AcrR family transcriptional regulator n=1 Tax=Actinomadura sp. 1N219 TaxID=3375152 RepID=UPI003788D2DC